MRAPRRAERVARAIERFAFGMATGLAFLQGPFGLAVGGMVLFPRVFDPDEVTFFVLGWVSVTAAGIVLSLLGLGAHRTGRGGRLDLGRRIVVAIHVSALIGFLAILARLD